MTAQADSASFSNQDDRSQDDQERRRLRQSLRAQRRSLPIDKRLKHAQRVAVHLQRAGIITPGRRIGIYLALPEELSLAPFIQRAWQQHCQLFVPHITHLRKRRMVLLPFTCHSRLRKHRWGMLELTRVTQMEAVDSRSLDTILMPLVGFDSSGHRLGMGAGFYDRHFARRQRTTSLRRPRLIGVAFSTQHVAHLPHARHDVLLDAVVTEHGIQRF